MEGSKKIHLENVRTVHLNVSGTASPSWFLFIIFPLPHRKSGIILQKKKIWWSCIFLTEYDSSIAGFCDLAIDGRVNWWNIICFELSQQNPSLAVNSLACMRVVFPQIRMTTSLLPGLWHPKLTHVNSQLWAVLQSKDTGAEASNFFLLFFN